MRFIFLITGIIFLPALALGQENQSSYTLEECIEYALKNNVNIKNAAIEQEIAREKVQQTISTGLPQINLTGDIGYNFKIQQIIVEASTFDPSAPEGEQVAMEFGVPYSGNAGISLNQMIFNGSYFVGLKAAKTYTELSRQDWVKTKIDVNAAVAKAYYTVLVNQDRLELIKKNYSRIDSLLSDTRIMYEAGFVEKIDINRILVQMNNLKVELYNVENLLELSYQLLKFQMGMPLENDIVINEKIEDINFQAVEGDIAGNFNVKDRIEYSLLQTNRELVELDVANIRNQYFPQLYLYGNYGANTGRQEFGDLFSNKWFSYGVVGVQLRVPIFDGFLKKNQIEERKLQIEQINNSFDQLRNGISFEIDQAELQYKNSIENMAAQHENMTLAEEVYNISRIKYEEGVGSNIEVTNAETDLKAAQTNYYNALYNALIARVDLQKAYGTLDTNTNN